MDDCQAGCYHVFLDQTKARLLHQRRTRLGFAYYYCSIHRVYHCIAHRQRDQHQQPTCCECALLFFRIPSEALHVPDNDIPATTPELDGNHPPIVVSRDHHDREARRQHARHGGHKGKARALPFPTGGDSDADVIMGGTEEEERLLNAATEASVPINILCRVNDRNSVLNVVPYGDPRYPNEFKISVSQKNPKIIHVHYTDINGKAAVQPTGETAQDIRQYLAPLDAEPGDPLLRMIRLWCCWAQGFENLEEEIRWFLFLIFDLCNISIARRRDAYLRKDKTRGFDLLWESRYHLHGLVCIVEDLAIALDAKEITPPDVQWF
ncbi:hypothetical protein BJ170DRAFT_636688 [Xylariales sp. AK1849]|nr:hypothetical protein BJ170DRAFT_636688 [Xylariales sp. AK1849]